LGSTALDSFNGKVKTRIDTDVHLAGAVEELMLYTDEFYKDSSRTECLSLRVSNQSWTLGNQFFELNVKLSQHAISAICLEHESSLSKTYVHGKIASAIPTYFVHRAEEGAQRHTVVANEFEKYSCNCLYTKVNALPCRHILYILRTLELSIYDNYSYLPRWLKQHSFEEENSNSNDSLTSQVSSSSSVTTLRRKVTQSDRYHYIKP
jgi:hypothetical protein